MTGTPDLRADVRHTTQWSNGRPRLVALDIDGTLIDHSGSVSPRVIRALSRITDAGCTVVLATGRASFEVVELFGALGLPELLAVCSNGAVIATMPDGRIVASETFDPSDLLRTFLEQVPGALVAAEVIGEHYAVTAEFPAGEMFGPHVVMPLAEILERPVPRVIVRDPAQTPGDFTRLIAEFPIDDASWAVGFQAWLDIMPLGVTKASGLARVADQIGILQEEVLAIGDGLNDVEMLTWAGRGVAMGHAPAALHAVADGITGTLLEDGVAAELERWFGSGDN